MTDKPSAPGGPPDLVTLTASLRDAARAHGDPAAIAAADRAHDHAQAGDHAKVRSHLVSLQTVAALTPLVNAISNALAAIGA
jgi:hypothetical protein